jgi:hypothetical protein
LYILLQFFLIGSDLDEPKVLTEYFIDDLLDGFPALITALY